MGKEDLTKWRKTEHSGQRDKVVHVRNCKKLKGTFKKMGGDWLGCVTAMALMTCGEEDPVAARLLLGVAPSTQTVVASRTGAVTQLQENEAQRPHNLSPLRLVSPPLTAPRRPWSKPWIMPKGGGTRLTPCPQKTATPGKVLGTGANV